MRVRLLVLALLAGCSTAAPPAGSPVNGSGNSAGERRVLQLANEARQRVGCPALAWNDAAAAVAEAHSADMARRGYFSHLSPGGAGPGERLRAAGIGWHAMAENIALTPGADEAMRLWMASPGHRENLLSCRYTQTGIGEVAGRWTQLFLTP
jgi:uncharacterized protein YkwD